MAISEDQGWGGQGVCMSLIGTGSNKPYCHPGKIDSEKISLSGIALRLVNEMQKVKNSFRSSVTMNAEKSFPNLVKSNRNLIVFTIFRLIWNTKRTVSVC